MSFGNTMWDTRVWGQTHTSDGRRDGEAEERLSKTFYNSGEVSFDPDFSFSRPVIVRTPEAHRSKWSNPIPLYKNYRGKYPNALFKQKDTQLSILTNALQSLLSKMSQLAARFATVRTMQPENVNFFTNLTLKSQKLLNNYFQATHEVLNQIVWKMLAFLNIREKQGMKMRSLRVFQTTRQVLGLQGLSAMDQHEANISLLKPTVTLTQVHVLRCLTKIYEAEAQTQNNCVINWAKATDFLQIVDEARFKITKLEELYQTYQSTYEKENPEKRFLLGKTITNAFATRDTTEEATKKDKLKYLRNLVRKTKEHVKHTSKPVDVMMGNKKSLSMGSLVMRQRTRAERALVSGAQMSHNQALTSSVRMLLLSNPSRSMI